MKKLGCIMICLFLLAPLVFGQADKLYQTQSTYYRVYSNVSEEYVKTVADKMEACLKLFNSVLHFDLAKLTVKLRVVIYADQTAFNAYLQKLLGQTRNDFVYIHYADLVKCELVGYQKEEEALFDSMLLHQGLIQFLKAFVPSAPVWLQEGIAANLESSVYDKTKMAFTLEKNLAWLDSLKKIIKGEGEHAYMTLAEMLLVEKQAAIDKINTFYPEAWGMVYFLLNTPKKEYNRLLWDSISALVPANTQKDNSLLIKNKVFSWVDGAGLEADFVTFIQGLKTFHDHIEDGITFYNNNDLIKAKESFTAAKDIRPTDYFAFYYLGLIEYTNKQYYDAEAYYQEALALGADAALTKYALGVNAYADNEFDAAKSFLNEAQTLDTEKYGAKVKEILDRIEAELIYSEGDIFVTPPEETTEEKTTEEPVTTPGASVDVP